MECILSRRSIRKFADKPVPRELIEEVLDAANWAPSAKNCQPWRFYVLQGEKKDALCNMMLEAVERFEQFGLRTGSARASASIMKQAPVLVIVTNPAPMSGGVQTTSARLASAEARPEMVWPAVVPLLVEVQSVGAAFENMCLAAHARGLGSLWIGDIFMAIEECYKFVGLQGDLMGAVSLGYADVSPKPAPRKPWQEATIFVE